MRSDEQSKIENQKSPITMTEERRARFKKVIAQRQPDLTVILENVHDPHNIGAVMRTCESVGIGEIFVLYTEADEEELSRGKKSASSAKKWVDIHFYKDKKACFEHVRRKCKRVFATHLGHDSVSMYDLDLRESVALLFGNEHDGVSEEALTLCDGNFIIPQMGMVKSLNISVACAVTLYETLRQRIEAGKYETSLLSEAEQNAMFEDYARRGARVS